LTQFPINHVIIDNIKREKIEMIKRFRSLSINSGNVSIIESLMISDSRLCVPLFYVFVEEI